MSLRYVAIGVLAILVPIGAAAITGAWYLTAIPCGVLLGFFLAKGDLCSTSAFSEILIMRDGSKLHGLFGAAVVAMGTFAIAHAAGLIVLVPRPLSWASYLVAGGIFGVGMVLAGGCVSGSLYKAGQGHANAIVALIFVAVGMHLVDFGPLNALHAALLDQVVEGRDGAPVTFSSVTGIPFAGLAAGFLALWVSFGVIRARRRRPPPGAVRRRPTAPLLVRLMTRPWPPWAAGIAVGLLALPAWLSSRASGRDFPLCVSYGVEELPLPLVAGDLEYILSAGAAGPVPGGPEKKVYVWLVLFVVAVVTGSWLASRMAGRPLFFRRPRGELIAAATGGLLVGVGAALARGCILGNGVMGLALMSVGMVLFAVVAMLANWVTTRVYVIGR